MQKVGYLGEAAFNVRSGGPGSGYAPHVEDLSRCASASEPERKQCCLIRNPLWTKTTRTSSCFVTV